MTTPAPYNAPGEGLVYRAMRVVCPRAERRWLDAMFAELASIGDGGARAAWIAGAAGLIFAAVRVRAATVVPLLLWIAVAASFAGVIVFAIGSQSDFEGGGMDDDVFLRFAWLAGVLLAGFGFLAITRIFLTQDETPRHRN